MAADFSNFKLFTCNSNVALAQEIADINKICRHICGGLLQTKKYPCNFKLKRQVS